MPASTSTIPSPAASAQALQCGTPGQGSGSRSRHTPGTTRSPRPTSRLRVGLRMAAHGNVPPHRARRAPRPSRGRRYFAALARPRRRRDGRLLGAGRRRRHRGPGRRCRPRRRARATSPSCSPRSRTSRSRCTTTVVEDDRAAVHWNATGHDHRAALSGLEPTGARVELEGIDLLEVARRADRRATTRSPTGMALARQIGLLPPRGSAPSSACCGAFNARTRRGAAAGGARASGARRRRRVAAARRRAARR